MHTHIDAQTTAGRDAIIANVLHLDSGPRRHSSMLLSHLWKVDDLLLLATGSASLQVWVGLVLSAWVCWLILKIYILKKCTNKPVKRFQMKSNGCRDVQHTGLQSTQTRRNTGKQGAQTRGSSAHLPKHPYISGCTAYLTTKQFFSIVY